jgi:DNA polymerase-3 subunit alpha
MPSRIFIFDTETTALPKNSVMRIEKQPHVIELFGLTLNRDLEEIGTWQSLFQHHKPLEDITKKVTGITDELLTDAPKFFHKAEELKECIESHDCVVGHNLTFDMDRVDQEMSRCNMRVHWPKERICTVEQTEHIKGYRLSLTALHEHLFGTAFKDAHRAEPDVRALARCYIELVKRGEL